MNLDKLLSLSACPYNNGRAPLREPFQPECASLEVNVCEGCHSRNLHWVPHSPGRMRRSSHFQSCKGTERGPRSDKTQVRNLKGPLVHRVSLCRHRDHITDLFNEITPQCEAYGASSDVFLCFCHLQVVTVCMKSPTRLLTVLETKEVSPSHSKIQGWCELRMVCKLAGLLGFPSLLLVSFLFAVFFLLLLRLWVTPSGADNHLGKYFSNASVRKNLSGPWFSEQKPWGSSIWELGRKCRLSSPLAGP